eukprot:SAG22_NODE_9666_length_576_cov_0.857442_1_plen_119_part_10
MQRTLTEGGRGLGHGDAAPAELSALAAGRLMLGGYDRGGDRTRGGNKRGGGGDDRGGDDERRPVLWLFFQQSFWFPQIVGFALVGNILLPAQVAQLAGPDGEGACAPFSLRAAPALFAC